MVSKHHGDHDNNHRLREGLSTCMPCSQSSLMKTFSSSWLMPSTLLGTLQMRVFVKGAAGKAAVVPLCCRQRRTRNKGGRGGQLLERPRALEQTVSGSIPAQGSGTSEPNHVFCIRRTENGPSLTLGFLFTPVVDDSPRGSFF